MAGTLADDGSRQSGELDKHLSRRDVSAVLAEAGSMFRNESHDRVKAEISAKLFMLANRYDLVLGLLTELLAPTDAVDENKK